MFNPKNIFCRKRKQFPKNITIPPLVRKKRTVRSCRPIRPRTLVLKPSIWEDIVNEDLEFEHYIKKEKQKNLPIFECESSYLKRVLFPYLIPVFEKLCLLTLNKGVLHQEVRFFSFIDLMSELLYNINPIHIERRLSWVSCHQVYEDKYRPFYPYFWFLTPDEAATLIQALVRRFLVRCRYNLEEMKEERRRILECSEKQKRCYEALKDDIELIYRDPVPRKEFVYDPCNQEQH